VVRAERATTLKLGAAIGALALAAGFGAARAPAEVAGDVISCDPSAGAVSITDYRDSPDKITVGYRASDNALRVVYFAFGSEDADSASFDVTCPNPGGSWGLVQVLTDYFHDTVRFDGDDPALAADGFGPLPAAVRSEANTDGTSDDLFGHAGVDKLNGGSGADAVSGFEGDDLLIGGEGRDTLLGGQGDDKLKGANGDQDTIKCGSGDDTAIVDRGEDRVQGCERIRFG
jgi:Ca2+-binding RTX toxin-like protein